MLSVNSVVNRPDSKQFDLLCERLCEAELRLCGTK